MHHVSNLSHVAVLCASSIRLISQSGNTSASTSISTRTNTNTNINANCSAAASTHTTNTTSTNTSDPTVSCGVIVDIRAM
jgi:hypothetical protein